MRKRLAIIGLIAAVSQSAHAQVRGTTESRGDYLRLPDFTCRIEAIHETTVHPFYRVALDPGSSRL